MAEFHLEGGMLLKINEKSSCSQERRSEDRFPTLYTENNEVA
jgi:hypothetical protein